MLATPLHEVKHALLAKHMVLILYMIGSALSPQELKSYFITLVTWHFILRKRWQIPDLVKHIATSYIISAVAELM